MTTKNLEITDSAKLAFKKYCEKFPEMAKTVDFTSFSEGFKVGYVFKEYIQEQKKLINQQKEN